MSRPQANGFLAHVLAEVERFDEAHARYELALRCNPASAETLRALQGLEGRRADG